MVWSEIVLSARIILYNKVHNGTSLNRTETKKEKKLKTTRQLWSKFWRMPFLGNLSTGLEAFPIIEFTPACQRQQRHVVTQRNLRIPKLILDFPFRVWHLLLKEFINKRFARKRCSDTPKYLATRPRSRIDNDTIFLQLFKDKYLRITSRVYSHLRVVTRVESGVNRYNELFEKVKPLSLIADLQRRKTSK